MSGNKSTEYGEGVERTGAEHLLRVGRGLLFPSQTAGHERESSAEALFRRRGWTTQ
ncbi:hypothetical protein [Arthrobacter sp. efr-133-TYG-118]|uniref:hypothetical protein n=1 Tax=Arthrobacter sp. efr-133-TYG-118 TaxID=3040279 RepID=UPI00254A6241|nr:hypothetical protein [Arthrobacter sp. efr-133-TYG-118]